MIIDTAPDGLAELADEELLEAVQRRTFAYFWEGAHPFSGLAVDRRSRGEPVGDSLVALGGSGFGVMALIVAVERAWVTRDAALERLGRMLELLSRADRHHGAFPHFMDGRSGATVAFIDARDDGGDLMETALLVAGLLCVRQYFDRDAPAEARLRARITSLWQDVEWSWYTPAAGDVLYWHWSPRHGWALDVPIRGWNECLIAYLLAAAAPRHGIDPRVYHRGYAGGPQFVNGNAYYGIELPLGPPGGGPLYFAHYSFCGLDPRGLKDRYADYWDQNLRHARINRAHCSANPFGCAGYGEHCWGLTSSDGPGGYATHSPVDDDGTIAPTAALSSMPYLPAEALQATRHFLRRFGARAWGEYGFVDAFCENRAWFADTFLAVDQGPIIVMIENQRSGLLWRLFMSSPEVREGLRRLEFTSPHLARTAAA